jgi:hypothetical protein
MNELPAPIVAAGYQIEVTPLARGGRQDWHIAGDQKKHPALDGPDIIAWLRRFFEQMDAETILRKDDPVATGQALAKMETLLADMRFVRDTLKTVTAASMTDNRIRRIVVDHVATWEASSTTNRTNWQHAKIVKDMLDYECGEGWRIITEDGEMLGSDVVLEIVSDLYSPSTSPRVTPIKEAGLTVNGYCDEELDDDGKPVRTPAVRIIDNQYRRN